MKEFRLTPTIGELIVVILCILFFGFGALTGYKLSSYDIVYKTETTNNIDKVKGNHNNVLQQNVDSISHETFWYKIGLKKKGAN